MRVLIRVSFSLALSLALTLGQGSPAHANTIGDCLGRCKGDLYACRAAAYNQRVECRGAAAQRREETQQQCLINTNTTGGADGTCWQSPACSDCMCAAWDQEQAEDQLCDAGYTQIVQFCNNQASACLSTCVVSVATAFIASR
jgi:hypothetical protein